MEVFRAIASALRKGFSTMENGLKLNKQLSLKPTENCIIVATWQNIFLKHMTGTGKNPFIDMFRVESNKFKAFRDSGIDDLAMNRKFQAHVINLVKFVAENIEKPTLAPCEKRNQRGKPRSDGSNFC